jgi:glycerate 2-kinase
MDAIQMNNPHQIQTDLTEIFLAGVHRVNPRTMIHQLVKIDQNIVTFSDGHQITTYDLNQYSRILVIGAGKATAAMAQGIEDILGDRISDGLIIVKDGHTAPLNYIKLHEAGHPVPDDRSVQGSNQVLKLVAQADSQTLVLSLISGGGSALLTLPLSTPDDSITLDTMQQVTRRLLESGATIQEINTVRKHLSGISGGKLAQAIASQGAKGISLILSDVLGDSLEHIASGPTAPDPSTSQDALDILNRYGIDSQVPSVVVKVLSNSALSETPKPSNPIFHGIQNLVIGSNIQALEASALEARSKGYTPLILSSRINGEAREVAKVMVAIARDLSEKSLPIPRPACILLGGETTVTIKGKGLGGRNQEMALAFLLDAVDNPQGLQNLGFLSAGTDGNDGPTDAAGGIITLEQIQRAATQHQLLFQALENNDAYHFLESVGGLYKTGPTNTNVCDIQIILCP